MTFLSYFIPLFSSFLSGFFSLFFLPLLCLAFIATVPFIIRGFISWGS